MRFEGKVAIVSGGLGAMGVAIGRRLASEGARVVLADIGAPDQAALATAFEGLSAPIVQRLDVCDAASWAATVDDTLVRFGRLDVLVNNAGVLAREPKPFDEIDLAEWRRVFAVNVDGVLLGTQAAMRAMKTRGGGVVVNLGSLAAFVGSKDNAIYGASKGAVKSMTKHAALSAARNGWNIRVVAVHPGYVWTPLVAATAIRQYGDLEKAQAAFRAMNPSGRIVEPEDVAAAIAYLASDDARMVDGADLVIDGGRLIQ